MLFVVLLCFCLAVAITIFVHKNRQEDLRNKIIRKERKRLMYGKEAETEEGEKTKTS